MTLYDNYIEDVMSGKIVTGELVKLGVQRHLNDLERSKSEDFPYLFSRSHADRVIAFMGKLRLTGGAFRGKFWKVEPFQAFYFAMVYGWVSKEANADDKHLRRFTEVYWSTGRKSAKSEMSGGEEVYHLFVDGEGSPQIVNVANAREQAAYVYNAAHYMTKMAMEDYPSISKIGELRQYKINNTDNGGYITCLTADHKTNDGGNPHFASIDEGHGADDDNMVDVVLTGMGMRDQPLLKHTTTAGFNMSGPDKERREYAIKILRGEIVADRFFTMIYTLDEGDDWKDEKVWPKANPLMPISPKIDFMRKQCEDAVKMGGEKETQFKTKNLNLYVGSSTRWVSSEVYNKLAKYRALDSLKGLYCYLGVDLASIGDTTAVTAFFPVQMGLEKEYYTTMYFCPETKFDQIRTDGVNYNQFYADGWIKKTEGNVIDKIQIIEYIKEISAYCQIKVIGFDPYKAVDITLDLQSMGYICGQVRQGPKTHDSGIDYWEKQMLDGKIEHDGSPVTVWQVGNVEIERDSNDNKKMVKVKNKKQKKIDGPISVLNAIVSYLDPENKEEEAIGMDEMEQFLKATGQY